MTVPEYYETPKAENENEKPIALKSQKEDTKNEIKSVTANTRGS